VVLPIAISLVVGCGSSAGSQPAVVAPPAPPASPPVPAVLTMVGAHPRGFARISLADPEIRAQLVELAAALSAEIGRSPADCGIDPVRLERLQVAIGEPLRVAAELDGPIDLRAVGCLAGERAMKGLAALGVVLRDRPGGLAIEYQAEAAQTASASAAGADLAQRCPGAICGTATLGPAGQPLRVEFQLGKTAHIAIDGPGLGHGAAAVVTAIDQLRATSPDLQGLEVHDQGGALVVDRFGSDVTASVALALALRQRLLEAFKIPSSSMIPTLQINDHVFAAKGSLAGALQPGDILVHNAGGQQYLKRYLAGPGQVVTETEAGISIDGKPLVTEVVERNYHYADRNEASGNWADRSGTLVREHLGARSYLTLRSGPPHKTGTWTVPAGHVFLVGDNRNNSNDSRYQGAIPQGDIVGRVVGIYLAYHDGAIDWERMGTAVE
jgi:signal peptidase I